MVLFERIRELRESTGMSARKFAEELGIKYTTYYGYETGTREPGSEFIANFAKRFGVTTDYILGLEEKNPEKNPSDAIKEATEGMTTEDILLKFARSAGLLNDNYVIIPRVQFKVQHKILKNRRFQYLSAKNHIQMY